MAAETITVTSTEFNEFRTAFNEFRTEFNEFRDAVDQDIDIMEVGLRGLKDELHHVKSSVDAIAGHFGIAV